MRHTRTAAFHTLGCKLNYSESSTLARSLEDAGYARVRVEERPDVFVLNTCSVTENADKECRRHVRRFKNINPEGFIAVIGCYAQLKPQEIAAIPGVDLVLGANEKFELEKFLPDAGADLRSVSNGQLDTDHRSAPTTVVSSAIKEVKQFVPSYSAGDRTRTFLKVQDGCDYFCSFCTIPLARGRSRSGTITETLEQARKIAAAGVKEVVLTGVNIGDFGRLSTPLEVTRERSSEKPVSSSEVEISIQNTPETFLDLIQALDQLKGIERFRISSIEPNLLNNDIIDFVAQSKKFMPHFHIPLQSGSDVILERMRRRYDTALYQDRVERIERLMPHACIGADVITGTPGETEEEFNKTHEFLRNIPVNYLHVFTYSERANTTAVRMTDSVPMAERKQRTKQLRFLSEKLRRALYEKHLGTDRPVLFEAAELDGEMLGFTDNYVRVSTPFDPDLVNTVAMTKLEQLNADGYVHGSFSTINCQLTTVN